MRLILLVAVLLTAAMNAQASETYDLIFKTGTLDALPKDSSLSYDKAVSVAGNAELSEQNSGLVKLNIGGENEAQLKFYQGEKHRPIGVFPVDVGNPIIMYFVETVVRDVAANTGGSPFYIRNRVKESLIKFAEIESEVIEFGAQEISAQHITLRPFRGDKNVQRMRGYGELAVTVTMSEDVPGWYYSLVASASGPNGEPIYSSALTLMPEAD